MKLIPDLSISDENGRPILSYALIREAVSFINDILSHRESFLEVFTIIASQFCDSSQSIDRNKLFQKAVDVGDVSLQVLLRWSSGVTDGYYENTIAECVTTTKVIRIAHEFLSAPATPKSASNKALFLFIILLHECCHLLLPGFHEVTNNLVADKSITPAHIGAIFRPGKTQPEADCGYGLEFALFGGSVTLRDSDMNALHLIHVCDQTLPATGGNLRRFRIPREITTAVYQAIKAWYIANNPGRLSFGCRNPRQTFPLNALRDLDINRLPSDCEITDDLDACRDIDFTAETKLKVLLNESHRSQAPGSAKRLPEFPRR